MPCGGISPVTDKGKCWVCGKENAHHFCEEWDTFIHARCSIEFLNSVEGKIIQSHGHTVLIDFSIQDEIKDAVSRIEEVFSAMSESERIKFFNMFKKIWPSLETKTETITDDVTDD